MMDNIREKLVELLYAARCKTAYVPAAQIYEKGVCYPEKLFEEADHLIANGVTVQDAEQEKCEWEWKHRCRGGFRRYTGHDDFGVEHTITVDERFECYDPYCPACGKLNESIYLNFCPNCGKAMLPSKPPFVYRKMSKGE